MHSRRSPTPGRSAALLTAIAACAVIGACAASRPTVGVSPSGDGVLAAGARELATSTFGDEQASYRIVSDSGPGTAERTIGASASAIRPTQYEGREALLLTSMSRRGSSTFVDTALVLRDGLVPVWERAHNSRGWHARFDYDGATVRAEISTPDSTHRATHTFPHPVFNFNELDEIVRAVPLHDGYHTIVALYSEGDDGLEMDTITVTVPHDGHAWDVRFADPVIISHYAIDGTTRRIVAREVTYHKWPMRIRYLADSTGRS